MSFFLSPRGSTIGWRPRLMKQWSLVPDISWCLRLHEIPNFPQKMCFWLLEHHYEFNAGLLIKKKKKSLMWKDYCPKYNWLSLFIVEMGFGFLITTSISLITEIHVSYQATFWVSWSGCWAPAFCYRGSWLPYRTSGNWSTCIWTLSEMYFILALQIILGYRYNLRHRGYLLQTQAHQTVAITAP